MTSASAKEKVILLHRRLRHPSFLLLKDMYPHFFEKLPVEKLVCNAWQLVKLKRNKYPLEEKK